MDNKEDEKVVIMNDNNRVSTNDLLSMEPMLLAEYLQARFSLMVPFSLATPEDLRCASEILSSAANSYSFLSNMRIMARVQKRALKRKKESAEKIEDMLAREELFENQAAVVRQVYEATSRMVTVKQQIDQDMTML